MTNDSKFPSPTGSPIASRETDTRIMVRDADNEPMRPLDAIASDKTDKMLHPLADVGGTAINALERAQNQIDNKYLDGVKVNIAYALDLLRAQTKVAGGDELCCLCGTQTSKLAGNPSKWPIWCSHSDGTGVSKCHCMGCVSKAVTIPQPEAANVALDALSWIISHSKSDFPDEVSWRVLMIERALQTPASDGVLDDRSVDAFAVVFDGKIQPATATKYDHIAEEEACNCRISGKDDADVIAVKIIPTLKQSTEKDE